MRLSLIYHHKQSIGEKYWHSLFLDTSRISKKASLLEKQANDTLILV
jgi:hypothetical protein